MNHGPAICLAWFACLLADTVAAAPGRNSLSVCFDLACNCDDWQAGFADYPAGQESFYHLIAQCADDPTNLDHGFFLSGDNHSDDLFMFVKHPVCGLKPLRAYEVEACIEILSRAPTGCLGVGGDPGASVYVKFGVSAAEPAPVLQADGRLRMNVDIGHQSNSGTNAVVIGNIATTNTDCFNTQYEPKVLQTPAPLTVQSDENGTLWIFAGTDSGFEGRTSLFFTQMRIRVRKAQTDEEEDFDGNNPTNNDQHKLFP